MFYPRQNELLKVLLRVHELDEKNQTTLKWTVFLFAESDSDEKRVSFNCLWNSSATNGINVLTPNAPLFIPEWDNVESKLNEIVRGII